MDIMDPSTPSWWAMGYVLALWFVICISKLDVVPSFEPCLVPSLFKHFPVVDKLWRVTSTCMSLSLVTKDVIGLAHGGASFIQNCYGR